MKKISIITCHRILSETKKAYLKEHGHGFWGNTKTKLFSGLVNISIKLFSSELNKGKYSKENDPLLQIVTIVSSPGGSEVGSLRPIIVTKFYNAFKLSEQPITMEEVVKDWPNKREEVLKALKDYSMDQAWMKVGSNRGIISLDDAIYLSRFGNKVPEALNREFLLVTPMEAGDLNEFKQDCRKILHLEEDDRGVEENFAKMSKKITEHINKNHEKYKPVALAILEIARDALVMANEDEQSLKALRHNPLSPEVLKLWGNLSMIFQPEKENGIVENLYNYVNNYFK